MIFHTKITSLSESQINTIYSIYEKTFSAPPRKEIINEKEIKEIWLAGDHFISLLFIEDKIQGFALSTDISFFKDKDLLEDIDKACYFAEFAISEETRGNGYGKQLLKAHISYLKLFFNKIYTRSRIDIENVVKLYLNEGFKIIQEYTTVTNQEVSKKYIYKKSLITN